MAEDEKEQAPLTPFEAHMTVTPQVHGTTTAPKIGVKTDYTPEGMVYVASDGFTTSPHPDPNATRIDAEAHAEAQMAAHIAEAEELAANPPAEVVEDETTAEAESTSTKGSKSSKTSADSPAESATPVEGTPSSSTTPSTSHTS